MLESVTNKFVRIREVDIKSSSLETSIPGLPQTLQAAIRNIYGPDASRYIYEGENVDFQVVVPNPDSIFTLPTELETFKGLVMLRRSNTQQFRPQLDWTDGHFGVMKINLDPEEQQYPRYTTTIRVARNQYDAPSIEVGTRLDGGGSYSFGDRQPSWINGEVRHVSFYNPMREPNDFKEKPFVSVFLEDNLREVLAEQVIKDWKRTPASFILYSTESPLPNSS